ncbi:sensor histidine kinase [Metabacillus arenae]|uniref:histidine kinase n=1 Tax=Metabacillus arenae TaxID=2771434 RepID=A0A926NP42_9BACI|nr:sensor histidine kinase [Metabacillus arenae]MBD1381351.1 sensor histidine kinase [Metabacillus arenae]
MIELLITMIERLGIIVTVAFVMTRFSFIKQLMRRDDISNRQQLFAIVFFGFFGVIGTYTGLTFNTESLEFNRWSYEVAQDEAIANSRVIGIIIAGLLGGYKVGIGAGIIAGAHRYFMGGFTALACAVSAVVAGIISSLFHKKQPGFKLSTALIVGSLAEAIQMLIILLVAKPFNMALTLVEGIGMPMIIANGLGSALFLLIIRNVINEEEKIGALQAQKALRLAEKTLAYMRKGLNADSAKTVCEILIREVQASAISITDEKRILAHVGQGNDHHQANLPIQTNATKKVLHAGKMLIVEKKEIECLKTNCPLGAAVISPLKKRNKTVGTLKFYFRQQKDISHIDIELITGLSSLLSHQLEISEADHAHQLAKEAEIKALQAQISPHFLFNSLNIIVSLIRTNPVHARKLLIQLSKFIRQNLTGTTKNWASLKEEMDHVQAYLSIEQARFVGKLKVQYEIDQAALSYHLPPLTLQPIVENAIKHGIKHMDTNWLIIISVHICAGGITIKVQDNGKGIEKNKLEQLGNEIMPSKNGTGIGLYNVNRRLVMMFGKESALQFISSENKGTTVSFHLPKKTGEQGI